MSVVLHRWISSSDRLLSPGDTGEPSASTLSRDELAQQHLAAIVERRRHHGTIEAHGGGKNAGSTFIVRLPLQRI